MFKNAYQGGPFVEIFSTSGKDPLQNFKIEGNVKNVQKIFDKQMKGSIYTIDGQTTKIQIPGNEKDSLCLQQPFLVFQIYIPSQNQNNIKIEISITDSEKVKRRLIFHSGASGASTVKSQKDQSVKQVQNGIVNNLFHARIPIGQFKRDRWLNLSIDVFAFAHFCFKGINVKTIDLISLTSHCKLRKIFTMRSPLYDDDFDSNPELQVKLDKLTKEEFGGDSSQILFEFIPKNLDFLSGTCEFSNQFIFPHRIENIQSNENDKNSIQSLTENKSKIPLNASKLQKTQIKNSKDQSIKNEQNTQQKSLVKSSSQMKKRPVVQVSESNENISINSQLHQGLEVIGQNKKKSILAKNNEKKEKQLTKNRQVTFDERNIEESEIIVSTSRTNLDNNLEDSQNSKQNNIMKLSQNEIKKEEKFQLPGQLYEQYQREQYLKEQSNLSSLQNLEEVQSEINIQQIPQFDEYIKSKEASLINDNESQQSTSLMSEIKIHPQVRASKVMINADFKSSGNNQARLEIDFNLHDDDQQQIQDQNLPLQSQLYASTDENKRECYQNCFTSSIEELILKGDSFKNIKQVTFQKQSIINDHQLEETIKTDIQEKSINMDTIENQFDQLISQNQALQQNIQNKMNKQMPDESFKVENTQCDIMSTNIQYSNVSQMVNTHATQFGGQQFVGMNNNTSHILMQNTASDRFTSIKKAQAPQNIKLNKFSSSGIANFQINSNKQANNKLSQHLSPTPTVNQNYKGNIFRNNGNNNSLLIGNSNDMMEQTTTENHLVDFEIHLNNQDQFNSENEDIPEIQNQTQIASYIECDKEEDEISENIVINSIQSLNEIEKQKNIQVQENLRKKLQAKKKEIEEQQSKDALEQQNDRPRFGTQIVNYKPSFRVEQNEACQDSQNDQQKKIRQMTSNNISRLKRDSNSNNQNFVIDNKQYNYQQQYFQQNVEQKNLNKKDNLTANELNQENDSESGAENEMENQDCNQSELSSNMTMFMCFDKRAIKNQKLDDRQFSPPLKLQQISKAYNLQEDQQDEKEDSQENGIEEENEIIEAEKLNERDQLENSVDIEEQLDEVKIEDERDEILEQNSIVEESELLKQNDVEMTPQQQIEESLKGCSQTSMKPYYKQNILKNESVHLSSGRTGHYPTVFKDFDHKSMRSIKKLIRVQKVDILRDSLDQSNDDLAQKIKDGILPKSMFCLVDQTDELIDVEFDEFQSKYYINSHTKQYYKPL